MISKKIKLYEAEFSGIKIKMNNVTVFQSSNLETAIKRAKNLDSKADSFLLIKKDLSEVEIET